MKVKEKNEAIGLRKSGLTYKEILNRLSVSKSSLSYWLRNIELTDSQIERIYNKDLDIRRKFIEYNNFKHQKSISGKKKFFENASSEINEISRRELKLIGIALYWSEGYKTDRARGVEFTNSDPQMIKLMIKWFKEICDVADNKIKIRLQLHNSENIKKAVEFWSRITGIPLEQFTKPYIRTSPTSKKIAGNILEYGICHIRISDSSLLAKIKGWIKRLGGPIV